MDKKQISDSIESRANDYFAVSDAIWEYAETAFEETKSAALLSEKLELAGFAVERGLGGIKTAFKGVFGSGTPHIAILGEFDALPGLSQRAGVLEEARDEMLTSGHGCGHHLLGTASLAAAIAVKLELERTGWPGTVEFYGCPAEEGGSGKAIMAKAGCFDHLDAALTWHPSSMNTVLNATMLANCKATYTFHGVSAHAAAAPHLGRSALDAVELMNVGANFLREHIIPEARLHYAITDTGGSAPNVVQSKAQVVYMVRAPKLDTVREIYLRLNQVAAGAAMMTGTDYKVELNKTCADVIPNAALEAVLYENMRSIDIPGHSKEENEFAAKLGITINGKEGQFQENLLPFSGTHFLLPASSDVGDVSYNVPTAQITTACFVAGTPEHSWQMVTQGKTKAAHSGMLYAAKVLAATAADLFVRPSLLQNARAEWREVTADISYHKICEIFDQNEIEREVRI